MSDNLTLFKNSSFTKEEFVKSTEVELYGIAQNKEGNAFVKSKTASNFSGSITLEDMQWNKIPSEGLHSKKKKFDARLSDTARREYGWNTTFPGEYSVYLKVPRSSSPSKKYQQNLSSLKKKKKTRKCGGSLRTTQSETLCDVKDDELISASTNDTGRILPYSQSLEDVTPSESEEPSAQGRAQLEHKITECIEFREELLEMLKKIVNKIKNGEEVLLRDEKGNEFLDHLIKVRTASIETVEAISKWKSVFSSPKQYIWDGKNYLIKLKDDLNFLAIPLLSESFGIRIESMTRNPFMMPFSLEERKQTIVDLSVFPCDDQSSYQDRIKVAEKVILNEEKVIVKENTLQVATGFQMRSVTKTPNQHNSVLLKTSTEWHVKAEAQLEALSKPMESPNGIRLMDASYIIKKKGYLPLLPRTPPKTLTDLIHSAHAEEESQCWKQRKSPIVSKAAETARLYGFTKPRVSATDSKPISKDINKRKIQLMIKNKKVNLVENNVIILGEYSFTKEELQHLADQDDPPQEVVLILTTVLFLLSPGNLLSKDIRWGVVKKLLNNIDAFVFQLLSLRTVSQFKIRVLDPIIKNINFCPEKVVHISRAAAALCGWVLKIVKNERHNEPLVKKKQLLNPNSSSPSNKNVDTVVVHNHEDSSKTFNTVPGQCQYQEEYQIQSLSKNTDYFKNHKGSGSLSHQMKAIQSERKTINVGVRKKECFSSIFQKKFSKVSSTLRDNSRSKEKLDLIKSSSREKATVQIQNLDRFRTTCGFMNYPSLEKNVTMAERVVHHKKDKLFSSSLSENCEATTKIIQMQTLGQQARKKIHSNTCPRKLELIERKKEIHQKGTTPCPSEKLKEKSDSDAYSLEFFSQYNSVEECDNLKERERAVILIQSMVRRNHAKTQASILLREKKIQSIRKQCGFRIKRLASNEEVAAKSIEIAVQNNEVSFE